jgi:hypothetical protein
MPWRCAWQRYRYILCRVQELQLTVAAVGKLFALEDCPIQPVVLTEVQRDARTT